MEHSCGNCKHTDRGICDEPCSSCDICLGNNKWEAKETTCEWMSVNERLPKGYCLFCDIDGDVYYGYYTLPSFWWAEGQDDRIKNVTHWMPIPKAPNKTCSEDGDES